MNRQSFWILLIVGGLSLRTGQLIAKEPAGGVLIADSFEKGTNAPDGWQKGQAVDGVKYIYEAAAGSDGKRSLCLEKTANRYFPIAAWSRQFEHTSDKKFLKVTSKVKARKVTKAIIEIQFGTANGGFISKEWLAYIGQKDPPNDPVATHDWKDYPASVQIPEGTKQIVIAFQIYGPGKVWFDELEARYVDRLDDAKSSDGLAQNEPSANSETVETPQPIEVKTSTGASAMYLLVEPDAKAEKPKTGYPVLLVLPGGNGSTEFFPFVKNIHKQALRGKFVVAELIAPQRVWPTQTSKALLATTEESVVAIVDDVSRRSEIDRKQVYALAWSSSGPAVYAAITQESTPIVGAMIAMSVFSPHELPPLKQAAGRRIYLLHSPEDRVCPYRMATLAEGQLRAAGAKITLVNYEGGHGWHGLVFDQIRTGIEWMQKE